MREDSETEGGEYPRRSDVTMDPVLPPPFGEAASMGGVVVLFILMLLGMVLLGGAAQYFLGFAACAILTEALVVLAPICFLLRRQRPLQALRLHEAPNSVPLVWALLGVLSLAVLIAEFSYWSDQVFPMPDSVKAAYLKAVTPESWPELLVLLVAAGLTPGICEEVAFRGFFQRIGLERFGRHGGIALAAALFALMHLDPWHLIALFAIGVYLGYLFVWTGNLWISVAAHATNNAASVILLYLAPDTSLSQMSEAPPRWLLPISLLALYLATTRIRNVGSPQTTGGRMAPPSRVL